VPLEPLSQPSGKVFVSLLVSLGEREWVEGRWQGLLTLQWGHYRKQGDGTWL
jgi:hypothetical protein